MKPQIIDSLNTQTDWTSASGGTSQESTILYFAPGRFQRWDFQRAAENYIADRNGYVGSDVSLSFGTPIKLYGQHVLPVTITVTKEW